MSRTNIKRFWATFWQCRLPVGDVVKRHPVRRSKDRKPI
jgi:hypothetical protein